MTKSAPAFAAASFGIPLGRARRENVQALCLLPRRKASCPTEKERFTKEKEDERIKGSSSFLALWGKAKGYAGAFSRKR